jgi:methionyl aminopeptidase
MDPEILEKYRLAGRISREALNYGASLIASGVKLVYVADKVEDMIRSKGGIPAFPVNLAINDIAAHYTPKFNDKRTFETGELVKLDVGAHIDGYIGDNALTVEVGTTNWQGLIVAAHEGLKSAIEVVKPGIKLKHIGRAVEKTISSYGVNPISNLTGHSLEKYKLHAGKSIPNILDDSEDVLEVDDVIAIEPFSTTGAGRVEGRKGGNIFRIIRRAAIPHRDLNNFFIRIFDEYRTLPFSGRWCHSIEKSADSYLKKLIKRGLIAPYPILSEVKGGMVAQAEHTVVVTETGCEILTQA